MVGKAKSRLEKQHEATEDRNQRLKVAVDMYKTEMEKKSRGEKGGSLRDIADEFGIDKMAISRKYKGMQTIQEFNTTKQKLTPAEEETLADWIIERCGQALPPNRKQICLHAEFIRRQNHPEKHPVGTSWVTEFLGRHPEISTGWSRSLDTQRAQCLNPSVVKGWFDVVKEGVVDDDIAPECIWGMDETNCPRGNIGKERVAKVQGKKTQHAQGGANRETVTAIVTICADGTALAPTMIFKGQNLYTKWTENNVGNATCI
ncbi:hypothetical protein D9757_014444 [Collybiopsis confluens]|uniref:HTH CENPB-type domain-containing protein n=1 Tax=Collybiopsis confluens TaxID=2823264 RepID=A0A8H5CUT0_9AGAR|nr:hypothetical protein D9757_014444 [Collybiopsis confluens]